MLGTEQAMPEGIIMYDIARPSLHAEDCLPEPRHG